MSIYLCDNPFCKKRQFTVLRGKPKIVIDNIQNGRKFVFCSNECREAWILRVQKNKKYANEIKKRFEGMKIAKVPTHNPNLLEVKGRDRVIKFLKEKKEKTTEKLIW